MKNIKEYNKSKLPKVIISKRLDKYEKMPLFQKKLDKANAILTEFPPLLLLRERDNKRIKQYFEQGLPIEQIALLVELPENEVLSRLEEMGLNDNSQ